MPSIDPEILFSPGLGTPNAVLSKELFIFSGERRFLDESLKISLLTLTNTVSSGMFGIANFNFNDLQIISKSSLIIFMILGKIEIIAIFLLIKKIFFRE